MVLLRSILSLMILKTSPDFLWPHISALLCTPSPNRKKMCCHEKKSYSVVWTLTWIQSIRQKVATTCCLFHILLSLKEMSHDGKCTYMNVLSLFGWFRFACCSWLLCGFKMPVFVAPFQEISRWTVWLTPEIDTRLSSRGNTNMFKAIWQH